MVLGDLGSKLTNALRKLNQATVVDEEIVKECLQDIARALLQADVNVQYVKKMRDNIMMQFKMYEEQGNLRRLIQESVVSELSRLLDTERKPFQPKKGRPNVVMFVGLQGSGKTTTCTKYAYYYQKKGWRTSLVCADTFRAGAFDQLKQNATKVRIPFYGSYTETDPVAIAEEGVEKFKKEGFEVIIVDTSGRHKQETELFDEMRQVAHAVKPDEVIFVMDSSIGQACFDQASAFRKAVDVGSVIITKLDGHAKGGGALSAVSATQSPIIFIGTGEHFDNFEPFDGKSFIKRLLGRGDLAGLVDMVKDVIPLDQQPKLLETLKSGNFSFRDMKGQYQSVLKIGSFNQFMSMLPGVGTNIKVDEKQSIARVKKFICMIDSMTAEELDGEKPLNPSRIERVARGSGSSVAQVNEMIEEYKRLKKVFEGLSKSKLGQGNDLSALRRNPNQMMNMMKNFVDPKMMQQLGGMGNIMNLVKEMGKMDGGGLGGLGGLGDMMKKLKK